MKLWSPHRLVAAVVVVVNFCVVKSQTTKYVFFSSSITFPVSQVIQIGRHPKMMLLCMMRTVGFFFLLCVLCVLWCQVNVSQKLSNWINIMPIKIFYYYAYKSREKEQKTGKFMCQELFAKTNDINIYWFVELWIYKYLDCGSVKSVV